MIHEVSLTLSKEMHTLSIQANESGIRLDRYLTTMLSDISRTAIQQLIEDGEVLVNGLTSKSGYFLKTGDKVQVKSLAIRENATSITPRSLPLHIIYEDEDLLVVNKAAGMVVHPAPGHYDDTLVNALVAYYPDIVRGNSGLRPGIIHRLDKDTSGLMIIAKNAFAHSALAGQMKRHEIIKRYLALVEGVVALDQGSIDAPIGRNPRHRQQMAVTVVRSREARTHFRVQERFSHHTLLLLELETGRTHQIRVHLKAIGHPVVGDPVYGSGNIDHGLTLGRQFLHAYQLIFTHPTKGEVMHLEAPLPEDLQAILDQKSFL
ncbi:MAG TPA: RluA family pseudouridine synthase [Ktedonobacteraceae bacterium]|nr:RluA family pseudouridine synthase [Ktedonobacteraceae bacterium]